MMKNLLILLVMLIGVMPVSAETLNYRIIQNGSEMIIVPSQQQLLQKPVYKIENSAPAKIPYYSKKTLPKAKNRMRSV